MEEATGIKENRKEHSAELRGTSTWRSRWVWSEEEKERTAGRRKKRLEHSSGGGGQGWEKVTLEPSDITC